MPDLGLREILMVAVAATAAYLLLSVLRLLRIARRKRASLATVAVERSEPAADTAAEQAPLAIEEDQPIQSQPPAAAASPAGAPQRQRRWLPHWLRRREQAPASPPGAWPGESPQRFGDHLFRTTLESELQQLRSEVASLREELKVLKAARRVSPQYNEAMMLAQRGIDAGSIAAQCGISVGEAELVLALSRNKQEYDDYGEDDPRRSAG